MTEQTAAQHESSRVSTIELFFDLVFVFTITQLTHLVEHAPSPLDLLRALLVLALVWWMYDAYAWLTTDAGAQGQMRLVLIAGIVLIAAGVKPVVAGGEAAMDGAAWLLPGGMVVYLLGDVAFRWVMGIQPISVRALGALPSPWPLGLLARGGAAWRNSEPSQPWRLYSSWSSDDWSRPRTGNRGLLPASRKFCACCLELQG